MTVVIADSSPLNYLTLIGSVDVLHQLYGTVIVPQQVISELIDPAAPQDVRTWASNLPHWIDVREAAIGDDDMTHLDLASTGAAKSLQQAQPFGDLVPTGRCRGCQLPSLGSVVAPLPTFRFAARSRAPAAPNPGGDASLRGSIPETWVTLSKKGYSVEQHTVGKERPLLDWTRRWAYTFDRAEAMSW